MGQGVCNHVLGAREVDNITCKLGKVESLSGGPRRRETEKGVGERLMIGVKGKLEGFKDEAEMANDRVICKEFTSKAEYLDLAEDNFLVKKAKGDQDPWRCCCRTAPT